MFLSLLIRRKCNSVDFTLCPCHIQTIIGVVVYVHTISLVFCGEESCSFGHIIMRNFENSLGFIVRWCCGLCASEKKYCC